MAVARPGRALAEPEERLVAGGRLVNTAGHGFILVQIAGGARRIVGTARVVTRTTPETASGGAVVDAAVPDGSALCTACGLCCDGLFTGLRITPDELPLAKRAGKPILERKDGPHAALPCNFLAGTVCTVYAERYARCRTFTCKLLRGFTVGAVTLDTAHARIGELRRRRDAVRAAAGSVPDHAFYDRMSAWQDLSDSDERAAAARIRLMIVTFDLYANKHFRNKPDLLALS